MKSLKFLLLPIFVFVLIVWAFGNIRMWEIESEIGKRILTDSSLIKLVLTIVLPLFLIFVIKELKSKSGIYSGQEKNSILIAWTSFYLVGPACIGFLIIGILELSFKDWYGSSILAIIFLITAYFIPKITQKLPSCNDADKKTIKISILLFFLSITTVLFSIFSKNESSILFKTLYFFFIVAVGEELLFRGYLQSSFNLFFGKKFKIGTVEFGWGLFLSALLFGLIHSLVANPIAWPWMLFTSVGGLILGFIREKDGSLLAPIVLHILMDFPLIFIT